MPVADRHTSTTYSSQRYAHPFFVTAPPAARQPFKGQSRMTDWSKLNLGPVYSSAGSQAMKLADIIGKQGSDEIQSLGEIRFHAVGDTGVNHAEQAENVAEEMAVDYQAGAGGLNPAFLFHLGDVVYGPDKENHYGERFYRPYRHYPGKILGIPGNHDGEAKSKADEPSLSAFRDHFCAKKAEVPIQASGSGIFRENMTQPGVYWVLEAPFVRLIGLYSNRLENPGYLEGRDAKGKVDNSQITWLQNTLKSIAKDPAKKALVIATHHPPYSQGGHIGSTDMSDTIDAACAAAGITPDLFLSGHAHNYQRYTRRINQKQVPYIVAGTGGISPQAVAAASGQVVDPVNHVTFDASHESYGYLFLSVSKIAIKIAFWVLNPPDHKAFETITVDLTTGTVS